MLIHKIQYLSFSFNLHELFPPLVCGDDTGSLFNSLLEVKFLIIFPFLLILSPSSDGMSKKPTYYFYHFLFVASVDYTFTNQAS